jgi:hypothetical protein
MNWCWTLAGVALTGAMVVLSGFINYSFGFGLGTTELNARMFGAVSVVAIGMMPVLPLRIAMHWEAGRKARAVLGAVMFAILVAYAVAGSIGFGMQNRSQLAGSKETLNAQLSDQVADRDQAISRLKALGEDQPAAAIATKIEAAKKDRRWDLTEACTNATSSSSREFCQSVDRLKAQLDVARTATALREKIDRLNKSIEGFRSQGAGQLTDPQSFGLATILRTGQDAVRIGLSVLLALVIESVCCFGLLVLLGTPATTTGAEVALAEWVGRWLSEHAEPVPGGRCTLSELEADFRKWCRIRRVPPCDSEGFARLISAACAEIGLAANDGGVEGLNLKR